MEFPGDEIHFGQNARNLRMETLVKLRWLAFAGQAIAIAITALFLRFQFEFALALVLVGMLAVVNICASLATPRHYRLSEIGATGFLLFDILQLSSLLYLTGGIQNPFSFLILAPVTISAVSLRALHIVTVVAVSLICMSLLCLWHQPLPWQTGESFQTPALYQTGLWIAIVVASLFISVYVSRVANESRALSQALSAAELVLERENHLSKLDGLAAAAAHELGTPLATIALVSKEINRGSAPPELKEDLLLLEQEARRCRDILGKLTSLAEDDEPFAATKLGLLLEQIVSPHRYGATEIKTFLDGDGEQPQSACSPAIVYGIGNFVDNAVDFADSMVLINAHWTNEAVEIIISDDGPGFPPEVMDRLGEPYLTRLKSKKTNYEDRSGLGLGIFIAKTLLERSGGQCVFSNQESGGARISLRWSRSRFEKPGV